MHLAVPSFGAFGLTVVCLKFSASHSIFQILHYTLADQEKYQAMSDAYTASLVSGQTYQTIRACPIIRVVRCVIGWGHIVRKRTSPISVPLSEDGQDVYLPSLANNPLAAVAPTTAAATTAAAKN